MYGVFSSMIDILELFLIEWIWWCKVLLSLVKAGHGVCYPEEHCQVAQFCKAQFLVLFWFTLFTGWVSWIVSGEENSWIAAILFSSILECCLLSLSVSGEELLCKQVILWHVLLLLHWQTDWKAMVTSKQDVCVRRAQNCKYLKA